MSEFGRSFDRAQAHYEAMEPEDDHDCEEDGHQWRLLPGEAADGTRFKKCRECGLVDEI